MYAIDKTDPNLGGYDIEESDQGFRWIWCEVVDGKNYEDFGGWRNHRSQALEDAADDWHDNGSPSLNPRYTGMLRGLAKKAVGHERGNERSDD